MSRRFLLAALGAVLPVMLAAAGAQAATGPTLHHHRHHAHTASVRTHHHKLHHSTASLVSRTRALA